MNFSIERIEGKPGPERALVFHCSLKWNAGPAYLIGITGSLQYNGRVLSSTVVPDVPHFYANNQACLECNRAIPIPMIAPMSAEAILYVERCRKDDVLLSLTLEYRTLTLLQTPNSRGDNIVVPQISWSRVGMGPAIPRSDWLKRLKEMEWDEIELIEIPKLPLLADKNLEEALRLIEDARIALNNGDHKGVLVKCREALESAAQHESAEASGKETSDKRDIKKGFELLLSRTFPEHPSKKGAFDPLIQKLSDYTQLGRHAQYPALNITRAEADFAFTTTVALFSLIGRRLSGRETV